jgi:hypothetical protein
MDKVYLGDSVYADCDGYGIVLTTENGYGPSNTIILEPEVFEALQIYVNGLRKGDSP